MTAESRRRPPRRVGDRDRKDHLRGQLPDPRAAMAARGMFATTELGPLLAERGVVLSREQVYRLVVNTPERLNLTTLAALCDILAVTPADLIEVTVESRRLPKAVSSAGPGPGSATVRDLRPRRARIVRDDKS